MINAQHNTGYWDGDKLPILATCFVNRTAECETVRESLATVVDADRERLYATILALYLLNEIFGDMED